MALGGAAALGGLVAGAGGCAPADFDVDVGARQAEIIRGTRETGMPGVVLVIRTGWSGGGAGLCTGTALTPYVVLTAKHCVYERSGAGYRLVPTTDFLVIVGDDINDPSRLSDRVAVLDIRTTAGSNIDADIENGNDVALLLLERGLSVPTFERATAVPPARSTVTVVGYGRTRTGTPDPRDSGVKYSASMNVSRSGANLIETDGPAWTCQGDSGGPLFDASMRVAGVTSFGIGEACTYRYAYYTSVPKHAALIDRALDYRPPCTPMPEVCNRRDDDCDGVVDPGCKYNGEPCGAAMECAGGRCESVGGARICVSDCDPTTTFGDCAFEFVCEADGCGTGRCIPGFPGGGANGAPCASDEDCASFRCADVRGTRRCARPCRADGDPCPSGEVCDGAETGCGACLPYALSPAPRPLGAPCERGAQCASGMCGDERYCTQPCDAARGCGAGFHCRGGACVRGELGLAGAECVTAEDCAAAAPECVRSGAERTCAVPCDPSGTCAEGFVCGDTDAGRRCVRPGATLGSPCAASEECRSGLCATICTRICSEAAPCPEGFDCVPAGGADACVPGADPEPPARRGGGGCAIAPGARGRAGWRSGPAAVLALGAVAMRRLVGRGRRRRAARRR
jgi:hypothetical protein